MKRTGIVYLHKNKLNNKCYVGSTLQSPKRRWRKSDKSYNSYKNCVVFYRALQKYGWESFETTILENNVPETELAKIEEKYINQYNCVAPNGYNSVMLTNGRVTFTDKVKNKISKSKKEYYKNLDTEIIPHNKKLHIQINGIAHKECNKCGELKPLTDYGKYRSTWDKLNRSCKSCHKLNSAAYKKANPPKRLSKEELIQSYKKRKTVARPFLGTNDLGETLFFKSGMEASKSGFDKTGIRRSILKQTKYKGYSWVYADEIVNRVFARKCKIKQIKVKDEKQFLNTYHKQGYCPSTVCYGLYYNSELVQVLSFSKPRFNKKYQWEIIRLCSKVNFVVVGGASKLLKHFVKHHNPENIMTYADKNYSKAGKVYEKIGFNYVKDTPKGYTYQKDGVILSRFQCQKHKLGKLLGTDFDPNISETKNMKKAGYTKVFDNRNKLYELILT
jgi:group I intron endonuclease